MGGISTAYFCDPERSADLFEARPHIGGSASSIVVQDGGHDVTLDIGAEFFGPRSHPTYWSLLQQIGAVGASDPADDVPLKMPGTLAIFDASTRTPLFVSKRPYRTPLRAVSFFRFMRAARAFVYNAPSSYVTVGEWLEQNSIAPEFERDALLPWLASLTCCSVDAVMNQAALAFLLVVVRIFPQRIFDQPNTYCSRIGLGGVLQRLVDECRNLTVHTDAAVTKLAEIDGAWFVETPKGRYGPYESVVINAPPHASRSFLTGVPDDLLRTLGEHEYYSTRMIIHADPIYMPRLRRDWCSHNAAVAGDVCEATIWLGAFRRNPTTGLPVQLFKSWATHRSQESREIVAEQTFLHPVISDATMRATKTLEKWQGVKSIYFAGHYTTLTDLQETALVSGLAVAKALAPTSSRLRSFESRLRREGHDRASYVVDNLVLTH
jgi:predicted NAD/FAD-binding protein